MPLKKSASKEENNAERLRRYHARKAAEKKFGKAASQIGTPEFKIMKELRKEFAGYSIIYKTIEKKENKKR